VAVELWEPNSAGGKYRVYTPKDPKPIWLLAKAVFGTLDSGESCCWRSGVLLLDSAAPAAAASICSD
jgi:hypothetical protein